MAETALSFPTNVEEFGDDERISFSRLSNTYIAVHDDGSEFEFHPELKRWIIVDEENDDAQFPADDNFGYTAASQPKKRKTSPSGDEVRGACYPTELCRCDGASLFATYRMDRYLLDRGGWCG